MKPISKATLLSFSTKRKTSTSKYDDPFFSKPEWLELRYRVLVKYGRRCMACGESEGEMHVDHIKPRRQYPHLALVFSNLQVLCRDCNLGKGHWDSTDWRPQEQDDAVETE